MSVPHGPARPKEKIGNLLDAAFRASYISGRRGEGPAREVEPVKYLCYESRLGRAFYGLPGSSVRVVTWPNGSRHVDGPIVPLAYLAAAPRGWCRAPLWALGVEIRILREFPPYVWGPPPTRQGLVPKNIEGGPGEAAEVI